MISIRSVAILLALAAVLVAAPEAGAATSQLTPTPPVALPPSAAAPGAMPSAGISTSSVSSSQPSAGRLPRTGIDLRFQLLLAALLVVAGGSFRLHRPSGRR
jgi:hypothetical protein